MLKIINLINGYMWTPKIEAFYQLIGWYNGDNQVNIKKLE